MTARSWFALAPLPATGRPELEPEFLPSTIRAADTEEVDDDDDEDDDDDDGNEGAEQDGDE